MTKLMTQVGVEEMMYYGGIKRAVGMMDKAEDGGRAASNPYAKEILSAYVMPLAKVIADAQGTRKAGRQHAHLTLLRGMDPEAIAGLSVRTALNVLMQGESDLRRMAASVGRAILRELVLTQIRDFNPDLFHHLHADLGRRLSKDERHRVTVFKLQAVKAGIPVIEWPLGAVDQVGMWLLGQLQTAGLIDIEPAGRMLRGKDAPRSLALTSDILDRINEVRDFVSVSMPVYGPCVEPPRDWVSSMDGGFHTKELRYCHPCLIRGPSSTVRRARIREAKMPIVLHAVNTLQRTAWAVNTKVLDLALEAAKHFDHGDIVSTRPEEKPFRPAWMDEVPKDQMNEEQLAVFNVWKRATGDWHTRRKLKGTKYGRFYSATRAAEMFRDYPAIYFVYFADTRGRLYPMTYGLSPQGSDLQKALLHFATGLPMRTPEAVRWFMIHGANKFGFDKATLDARENWYKDKTDLLLSFAADPLNNLGWRDADCPLQFLAWCFEFAGYMADPHNFESRIPISMDGSCNGLQNLSAMLRDEIGGRATNLTANKDMQDIYRLVAEAAQIRMEAGTQADPRKEKFRKMWLQHGIKRSLVKRSVMTTPYGVTKRSAIDYVLTDYLARGSAPEFDKPDWLSAAAVLMEYVWPAIGDVVVKGREAMDWLKATARAAIHEANLDDPVMEWTTPSGFPATQAYFEIEEHRIRTLLQGPIKLRVRSEGFLPDVNKHAGAFAPNFVHSLDAAHLQLTVWSCRDEISSLAMIHDDYGTHAANAQCLYTHIRKAFVEMYTTHNVIETLHNAYPLVTPPQPGTLDINEVLDSQFFFS